MTGERMSTQPRWAPMDQQRPPYRHQAERPAPDDGPDRAMEVLVIAQRTAEEHSRTTRAQAESMRTEALAAAGGIVRDAEAMAQDIRRKAERALADANATADAIARRAQERADEIERTANAILSEARNRADRVGEDARTGADEMRRQAKEEYDGVLGRLHVNRETLLMQIESLEQFDRDFRQRLLTFMQTHMRALLADDPQLADEAAEPPAEPNASVMPIDAARRSGHRRG